MIYQIDLDISNFKKYELEKILDLSHFIKCDDNKIDTFRLVKDKSYFFELKHMWKFVASKIVIVWWFIYRPKPPLL